MKREKPTTVFLIVILVTSFLLALVFVPLVNAQSTCGTASAAGATYVAAMRKNFKCNGLFWVVYFSGVNMVYNTSSDGVTWGSGGSIRAIGDGSRYSCTFNGTHLYYAFTSAATNTPMYFRCGLPQANGTITWVDAAGESIAVASQAGHGYAYPTIAVDGLGYPWIGYRDITTNTLPWVTRSDWVNGTWHTNSTFPYQLSTTAPATDYQVTVVPLSTQADTLCLYAYPSSTLKMKRFFSNGTWSSEVASADSLEYEYSSNTGAAYSVTAQGNDVHIVYLKNSGYDVKYMLWNYTTNTLTTAILIRAGMSITSDPVTSLYNASANSALYVFWATKTTSGNCTANHIYYREWYSNTSTWNDQVDWQNEATDALWSAAGLDASYGNYDTVSGRAYIGVMYETKTATPFNVRFAFLNITVAAAGAEYSYTVTGAVTLAEAHNQVIQTSSPTVQGDIGLSTADAPTTQSSQKKMFYCNGLYWAFYLNGTHLVYSTSSIGSSWTNGTSDPIKADGGGPSNGGKYAVWCDGTFFYYVFADPTLNTAIVYRNGTANADGTITWNGAEETVLAAVASRGYYYPSLTVTTDGKVVVAYRAYTDTNSTINEFASVRTTSWGTPIMLNSVYDAGPYEFIASVSPLTSGCAYCVYTDYTSQTVKARKYNGSGWDAEETITGLTVNQSPYICPSTVAEGDDVCLAILNGTTQCLEFYRRTSGSWARNATLQANVGFYASVALEKVSNVLVAFWFGNESGTNNHILYKQCRSGTWDTSPTDWITETYIYGYSQIATMYSTSGGCKASAIYITGNTLPRTVRFAGFGAALDLSYAPTSSVTLASLIAKATENAFTSTPTLTLSSLLANAFRERGFATSNIIQLGSLVTKATENLFSSSGTLMLSDWSTKPIEKLFSQSQIPVLSSSVSKATENSFMQTGLMSVLGSVAKAIENSFSSLGTLTLLSANTRTLENAFASTSVMNLLSSNVFGKEKGYLTSNILQLGSSFTKTTENLFTFSNAVSTVSVATQGIERGFSSSGQLTLSSLMNKYVENAFSSINIMSFLGSAIKASENLWSPFNSLSISSLPVFGKEKGFSSSNPMSLTTSTPRFGLEKGFLSSGIMQILSGVGMGIERLFTSTGRVILTPSSSMSIETLGSHVYVISELSMLLGRAASGLERTFSPLGTTQLSGLNVMGKENAFSSSGIIQALGNIGSGIERGFSSSNMITLLTSPSLAVEKSFSLGNSLSLLSSMSMVPQLLTGNQYTYVISSSEGIMGSVMKSVENGFTISESPSIIGFLGGGPTGITVTPYVPSGLFEINPILNVETYWPSLISSGTMLYNFFVLQVYPTHIQAVAIPPQTVTVPPQTSLINVQVISVFTVPDLNYSVTVTSTVVGNQSALHDVTVPFPLFGQTSYVYHVETSYFAAGTLIGHSSFDGTLPIQQLWLWVWFGTWIMSALMFVGLCVGGYVHYRKQQKKQEDRLLRAKLNDLARQRAK